MHNGFNPLVPRPIDKPTDVPMGADADLSVLDDVKIFVPPADPAQWPAWRAQITRWREEAAQRLDYSPAMYDRAEATWAQSCFTVAQVWLWDELLYDAEAMAFTPEKLLADATERLGGFDGVVLWHAYPVIGIDDRNQWDYYRQVPGLKELVDYFHSRGVRVFVDYNPWDTETRRSGDDVTELAALIKELEADGIFLDTMKEANPQFVAALEEARPGIALEGESKLPLARVTDHSLSWAQWFADSDIPGVLRAHWFERKHMQHHIRRWNRDHSQELQSAWINGVGLMTWEIVFGVWVGWNQRDAATLRRMLPTLRGMSRVLVDGEWMPLAPLASPAHQASVFASRFHTGDATLWTAVNRGTHTYSGPLLCETAAATDAGPALDSATAWADDLWFDLATGAQLDTPSSPVTIPAHSIGGVLRVCRAWEAEARDIMAQVAAVQWTENAEFQHRRALRVASAPEPSGHTPDAIPAHVRVDAGEYTLTVEYRMRETGMYQGAPYVNEWKPLPPRLHDVRTLEREVTVPRPLAVASREVTNAEFLAFLQATGYTPRTEQSFLAHWDKGSSRTPYGQPNAGTEDQPVTYVLLDDAHAYCAWTSGVLPTEDEWQIAAQNARATASDVQSSFQRLTPAVWNLTNSEHSDGRSRFVFLKGGMDYLITDSDWYFDGGVRKPEFSAKYLLPGFGMARSANIGFRCAWPLATNEN